MPPVVSNRVLKRQPLNIYYLRKHLLESQRPSILTTSTIPESQYTQEQSSPMDHSGSHFEQPLPINSFTSSVFERFSTAECDHMGLEREHSSCPPLRGKIDNSQTDHHNHITSVVGLVEEGEREKGGSDEDRGLWTGLMAMGERNKADFRNRRDSETFTSTNYSTGGPGESEVNRQ